MTHPMIGRRCVVRCESAGVHIGTVVAISQDGRQAYLKNALRLWSWSGGGLSLSAIASNGVKQARINRTWEIWLTDAIEYIPTTRRAEKTFVAFIEDVE